MEISLLTLGLSLLAGMLITLSPAWLINLSTAR
ncbi:Uncharacterised protein [Edwardsiella hoshinae]|uniref:Uncharacterized protein n=1 Tax=Edwardsiella hoshinae TaxID=93378 RepID=A0A376DCR6_9GAMM|nr:Uncharacterised protein [Edwardsiella hoshinae]